MSPKKRKKKGSRRPRKPLGRGAKAFLLFLLVAAAGAALWWGVQSIRKQLLEGRLTEVAVDGEFFGPGDGPGQFKEAWGIAVGPDNSVYVSDFGGHRVEKFSSDAQLLQVIGSKSEEKNPKPGTFNQPSGMYVDPEGFLYVCDTFNHRVQKFDPSGKVVKAWSRSFFGPRGVAGDGRGRLYITDTGNHKVQVFTKDGEYLDEWGGGIGREPGKFSEPVGITVGPDGSVYVADVENRRIQKFEPDGKFKGSFPVETWQGKCCETPYLVVGPNGLYATNASANSVLRIDPKNGRIQAIYRKQGMIKEGGFDYASGIALDSMGRLWVVEKSSNKVARFSPPRSK